jgi:FkbM family methyltransferase
MSLMSNRFRLIIDVGAHVGSSTDLMNQYFPNSTIIAFEPDPRNNDLFGYFLSHRITAGDVVLMKQAVWSSSGEIPFDFQPSNTADNKFDPESALKVPCVSIDDYIFREGFEVDLIKVDVQGYELEVIQGAIVTIQKYKPLLILELDYDALDARGHSENDLLELLWKLDYRVINPLDGNTLTETQVRNLMTVERCLDLLLAPLSHEASQEDPK